MSLSDLPPRTHTGDPETSHRAEAKIRKSSMWTHTSVVLAAVNEMPGLTPSQLAEYLACDPSFSLDFYQRLCQVRKRISDLKAMTPPRVRTTTTPGEREYRCFAVRSA